MEEKRKQACPEVRVPADQVERFMAAALEKVGVPPADAAICAETLIAADLRGIDSHGINRLKPIYIDRIRQGTQTAVTRVEVVRDGPTATVIDGHNGMGLVIGRQAMAITLQKAKKLGMAMTAVRNSNHYGIAGFYGLMAADQGMIGITGTNARPSIAPTFGVENMLGTNPMTFVMPSDEPFPFFLDCATSVTQRGKIELYAREGKPTPAGLVIDRDGRALTDSDAILARLTQGSAALLPVGGAGEETGGYKGYGYATVVEILSAALQQGNFLRALTGIGPNGEKIPFHLGHFFIAIDTEAFMGRAAFEKICGDILRDLRGSQKAPGEARIYTAGEKEYLAWQERKDSGVPINDAVQKELISVRDALGLSQYRFPFE